jgi:hypothetical protein
VAMSSEVTDASLPMGMPAPQGFGYEPHAKDAEDAKDQNVEIVV